MLEDQLQMKNERDGKNKSLSQKESLENNDEFEVGEFCVPSPKVIQHEVLLTQKSLEHVLHGEQPFYLLCQGTHTCTSNESSTKSFTSFYWKSFEIVWEYFP